MLINEGNEIPLRGPIGSEEEEICSTHITSIKSHEQHEKNLARDS